MQVSLAGSPLARLEPRRQSRARENIRKKLAMGPQQQQQQQQNVATDDADSQNGDLQICFMNEIASDDELLDSASKDLEPSSAAVEEIARYNISQKTNQIIVPIYRGSPTSGQAGPAGEGRVEGAGDADDDGGGQAKDPRHATFQAEVRQLQASAREGLLQAKDQARRRMEEEAGSRRSKQSRLFDLLGIKECKKLGRRTLSSLNVGQLQVIQNDFLAQIEGLNEELVRLLMDRDEMVMEQDAMLTDIEDLSEFIKV